MADLQRQIGDHARAAAEVPPRSTVGDVIQPGQPIPDDVVAFTDNEGDAWRRAANGHVHLSDNADRCDAGLWCTQWSQPALSSYAPLTVTAVREQPAEPERHRYQLGPGMRCSLCGQKVQDAIHLDIHEDLPGRTLREQREAYQAAAAEPQQADEPALLDLVRQYGAERQRMGSASIAGSAPVVHEHKTRAAALFARIAALVPQQPDPMVLRLPEGTVALIGGRSGRRFTRVDRDGPKDWWNAEDGRQSLGSVMDLEGTVRVELAPPREPRTAAEIWAELDEGEQRMMRAAGYGELAEALDREAGR